MPEENMNELTGAKGEAAALEEIFDDLIRYHSRQKQLKWKVVPMHVAMFMFSMAIHYDSIEIEGDSGWIRVKINDELIYEREELRWVIVMRSIGPCMAIYTTARKRHPLECDDVDKAFFETSFEESLNLYGFSTDASFIHKDEMHSFHVEMNNTNGKRFYALVRRTDTTTDQ